MSGLIVFNGADRNDCDGIIDQVSINFCTAPTSSKAEIKLYIIKAKVDKPGQFQVQEHTSPITDLKESIGEQTFKVQILVEKDDYLGFQFADNAGSPFTLQRDSYFFKFPPSYSDTECRRNEQDIDEELTFIHCATQGITVNFRAKDTCSISREMMKISKSKTIHPKDTNSINTSSTENWQLTKNSYYSKKYILAFPFVQ
jgi:hypothetical protein